jgi:hypothetical protein
MGGSNRDNAHVAQGSLGMKPEYRYIEPGSSEEKVIRGLLGIGFLTVLAIELWLLVQVLM